ncbi:MAG: YidC/Oxa1 family membrane protein insertase, partial [Ilumatobacteraceae bacterium]
NIFAWPFTQFYALTNSYVVSILLVTIVVVIITTPLTLKSTKSMLEMQRLQPELRRLQQEHRGDRQKLNEEMMKLYQEHRVNPLASCLPLLLQMPVFIIMFQVLHGLTAKGDDGTFVPKFVADDSEIYQSLVGGTRMLAWGLDLAVRPLDTFSESFGKGLLYAMLVVALGVLYWVQQRMVASRAAVSPTVSPTQQKVLQYLPVVFAVFLVFYLTGLVIYYMAQAVIRIGLNWYITHRFYKGDESLGRQAQRAGERARELAAKDGGGGMFAQMKKDLAAAKQTPAKPTTSKRVTPPKGAPTPRAGTRGRPSSTGRATRPPSRKK